MERDRNLLFGIFAVQIKGVAPKQIVEAGAAWATDTSKPLSARLVELGALSDADVALIDQLVNAAIAAHSGDASSALITLGGEEQVDKTFYGSIIMKPSGGLDTRPMINDSFLGEPVAVLSTVEEYPGRYSHISEYGRGGMGRVLLVHDEHMGRDVALKELLMPKSEWPGPGDSPAQGSAAVTARFLQEARLTGKLEHPAIVPVYELGRRKNGTLYYTMKLVRGKTLSKALRECKTLQDRLSLLSNFVDLCQAVAYAHSRGVIHRDIKPANVMVGAFGETVVLDWGLAKGRDVPDIYGKELESTIRNLQLKVKDKPKPDVTPFETRVGEAVGTPHYMSPEQAEGRIPDITERSDIYSLGVVLYELLTGKVPFDGPSIDEIFWRLLNDAPPDVDKLEPNAPAELIEVCKKAMSKAPDKRYESAAALAAEIKRFMSGSFVQAYKYTPAQVLTRYYRQHRLMVNTVAAGVIALISLGVFSYVNILQARNNERDQRVLAEAATAAEVKAKDAEEVARAEAERQAYIAQLRLAEKLIEEHSYTQARDTLWATPESLRNVEWGLLLTMAYPDKFLVRTPGVSVFGGRYSPDGQRILVVSYPDPPKIYDANNGNLLVTAEFPPERFTAMTFSPDGGQILASGEGATLTAWDAQTGKVVRSFAGHSGVVYGMEFNRAGTEMLSSASDGVGRIWDPAMGTQLATFSPGTGAMWETHFSPDGSMIVVATADNNVRVYDRAGLVEKLVVPGNSASFSPDGQVVAVRDGKDIALYDAATGSQRHRLTGHLADITSIQFDAASTQLISASFDRTAKVWDLATGNMAREFNLTESVLDAKFVASDRAILLVEFNNQMSLWDPSTGNCLNTYNLAGLSPKMVDVSPDGGHAVTAAGMDTFQAWDLLAPPGQDILVSNLPYKLAIAVSADGQHFVASGESQVEITDMSSVSRGVKTLASFNPGYGSQAMAVSQDGSRVVVAPGGFTPLVWDPQKQSIVSMLEGQTGALSACALSPDGNRVVSGHQDGQLIVWEAETGKRLLDLQYQAAAVFAVAVNADASLLVSGDAEGLAKIWNLSNGKMLHSFSGHKGSINAAAFSPDSSRVFTGGDDGALRGWNVADGKLIVENTNAQPEIANIDILGDGNRIASVGRNRETLIWNAPGLESLVSLPGTRMVSGARKLESVVIESEYFGTMSTAIAPQSVDVLQGDAGGTWREKYEHGRMALFPQRDVALDKERSTLVATAEAKLIPRIQALVESLAANGGGLGLGGLPKVVRDHLQLPAGGTLSEFNGQALGDLAAFRDAVENMSVPSPISITVANGKVVSHYQYQPLPTRTTEITKEIDKATALKMLKWQRSLIEQQITDANDADPALGLLLQESSLMSSLDMFRCGLPEAARVVEFGDISLRQWSDAAHWIGHEITEVESVLPSVHLLKEELVLDDFHRIALTLAVRG